MNVYLAARRAKPIFIRIYNCSICTLKQLVKRTNRKKALTMSTSSSNLPASQPFFFWALSSVWFTNLLWASMSSLSIMCRHFASCCCCSLYHKNQTNQTIKNRSSSKHVSRSHSYKHTQTYVFTLRASVQLYSCYFAAQFYILVSYFVSLLPYLWLSLVLVTMKKRK